MHTHTCKYTHTQTHVLVCWPDTIFFFLIWGTVALHCSVSFCSTTKWISYTYTYIPNTFDLPPLWPPSPLTHLWPTPLGHCRALRWAPWDAQQLLISSLFYTWQCIYGTEIYLSYAPFSDFLMILVMIWYWFTHEWIERQTKQLTCCEFTIKSLLLP